MTKFLPAAENNVLIRQIKELIQLVERQTAVDGVYETIIPNLRFYRSSNPTKPTSYIYETTVCFAIQGRKQITVGQDTYIFDPSDYLIAAVDLPATGQILDATPDKPYLGIILNLNPEDLASLIIESEPNRTQRKTNDSQAVYLSYMTSPLADALIRLIKLLDAPQEISIMAPLIQREINFRLLQSEHFDSLLQATVCNGKLRRISLAIDWLRQNLKTPLRIEELAKHVNMSASGLHHQFKEVTSLSPLQFQKRLRLLHARNLLMTDNTCIEQISYQVGYESASQFSREYRRLFGQPPSRDAHRLRTKRSSQT